MTQASTIGIVGVGNLGTALLRGLIGFGADGLRFCAYDAYAGRLSEAVALDPGRISAADSVGEVVRSSDIVIVAVKPQDMDTALAGVAGELQSGQTVVSTAAGVTLARLRAALGTEAVILRIMPNLAVAIGEGVIAVAGEREADAVHARALAGLLAGLGTVEVLDESLFDVVTAVAGSGPGFMAVVLEALEDGAVRAGLPRPVARAFVRRVALGTSRLLEDDPGPASALKDQVSSPGGTTIAGLAVLEDRGVRGALLRAVEAAAERSRQL